MKGCFAIPTAIAVKLLDNMFLCALHLISHDGGENNAAKLFVTVAYLLEIAAKLVFAKRENSMIVVERYHALV